MHTTCSVAIAGPQLIDRLGCSVINDVYQYSGGHSLLSICRGIVVFTYGS